MKETLHIYTRVSSSAQEDGTSLDTQRDDGIKYAVANNFKHKLWNEGAASSHDEYTNRQVIVELLAAVETGEAKHIYVYDVDRLSRNSLSSAHIADKLERNQVTLHTTSGKKLLSDHADKFTMDILRAVAVYDNATRQARFRLGKLARIRQGRWIGGQAPFGYDLKDSKLVVNKDEAKWVKHIFALYNKGYSSDKIRGVLLDNGVLTKRGKAIWSEGSVSSLLTNTHYIGHYDYVDKKSGERIRSNCSSILTASVYKKYLEAAKKRSNKRESNNSLSRNKKQDYSLSELLVCGCCNSLFTTGTNKYTKHYRCRSVWKRYRNTDTNYVQCKFKRTLRMEETNDLIWESVVDTLEVSNLYRETVKNALLPTDKAKEEEARVQKSNAVRIRKLSKVLDKITDAIIKQQTTRLLVNNTNQVDAVIKELEKRKLDTGSQIEELQEQIDSNQRQGKWIDWYKSFGTRIEKLRESDLTEKEKNEFLKGIIASIKVSEKDEITHNLVITFREPYVDDKLIWVNEKKKSLGYSLKNGKKTKRINKVNISKKIR